jgi:hypothetical protein
MISGYLLLQPIFEAVKDGPVVCQVGVHCLMKLHVHDNLARLVLGNKMTQRRKQKSEGVRS